MRPYYARATYVSCISFLSDDESNTLYKVARLVHHGSHLSGQTPVYLANDIKTSSPTLLRSASTRTCVVPRTHNSNFGDKSRCCGPGCMEQYVSHLYLRQLDISHEQFKRLPNTFLFGR